MTPDQIEQFRKEFKNIVYQYSQIASNGQRLKQLHAWDKNGSHEKAILRQLDERKLLQHKLKEMLKEVDYEDWKLTRKLLSHYTSKLKAAIFQKEKYEAEINNLNFKL